MEYRYFEDFQPGQRFACQQPVAVTQSEIMEFARKYDPQYFHTDPEKAKNSLFGGLAASGWLTAGLTMRMILDSGIAIAGGMIGRGVESIEWPIPVRPGDVLRCESEILETVLSKSNPSRGRVRVRTTTYNQNSEIVMIMVSTQIVPAKK